jgi:hypothetical protein
VPNRVCFLVDGFNVYHSVVAALQRNRGQSLKWLDLAGLCASYMSSFGRDATLERIFYFSAPAHFSRGKAERHATYVEVLQNSGLAVQLGRFKEKDVRCPHCKASFKRHEEKETDVAIAVKMLELLHIDACDTIALMTGDTDIAPAIRTAKTIFPDKQVWMIFPFERVNEELRQLVRGHIKIKAKAYASHQLPNPVRTADARLIWKPAGW